MNVNEARGFNEKEYNLFYTSLLSSHLLVDACDLGPTIVDVVDWMNSSGLSLLCTSDFYSENAQHFNDTAKLRGGWTPRTDNLEVSDGTRTISHHISPREEERCSISTRASGMKVKWIF